MPTAAYAPARGTAGPRGLTRRELLRSAVVAAGAAALGAALPARPALADAALPAARWPGHQPGRIHLGLATEGDPAATLALTGPVGLTREYYGWSSGSGEIRDIVAEQAAGRLPWVSFRPPFEGPGAWAAVASGAYDADLRARAQRYAALTRPVVVTFDHEPQTRLTNGTPGQFAAAWSHVHDVMHAETGLRNVASVPIIGDWVFNPLDAGPDPQDYLTPAVLQRCSFVGVDVYQNRSCAGYDVRIGRVLSFLDARGWSQKMVGIGETGACNSYPAMTGAQWWTRAWAWASAHTDRIGAVSYFDSLAANNSGNDWLLTESPDKLAAFRASLGSPLVARPS